MLLRKGSSGCYGAVSLCAVINRGSHCKLYFLPGRGRGKGMEGRMEFVENMPMKIVRLVWVVSW